MTTGGPDVVTSGLVLYLDAANKKSYSGSGNTAFNICDNSLNISFYNTAVITENSFDFTSLDTDGLSIANTNYQGLYDFTMECVFKLNGTHLHYDGALMSSGNWNNVFWSLGVSQANSTIQARGPNITHNYTFNTGIWYYLVYRRNGTVINFFINNSKTVNYNSANNIPLVSNATNTAIGRETYAGGYFNLNGKISIAKIYNRALLDEEITQNYNALKGRFGL